MSSKQSIPTDPSAIERAIRDRQQTLASTVDELVERVQPKNLAESAKQGLKDRVSSFVGIAKKRGRDVADTAKVKFDDASGNAKDKVNEATSTAKEKVAGATQAASDKAHAAKDGTSVTNNGSGQSRPSTHAAGTFAGEPGTASNLVHTATDSARHAVSTAKGGLTDQDGNPDQARVAAVAAGTASAVLFVAWLASRGK